MIEYKDFYIKDVFETFKKNNGLQVPTGASVPKSHLASGNIPRISVTKQNNGIAGYYESTHPNHRVYHNFISVSFLGTIFYQKDFASLDMKVHCLKPKMFRLNTAIALYLITVLRKALASLSYSEQISSTELPDLILSLPVKEGEIDLAFMESEVKRIQVSVDKNLEHLSSLSKHIDIPLNLNDWKRFHLYDDNLFIIESGNKLDKAKMTEISPEVNFVGRANQNNGITGEVDLLPDIKPYSSGNLTLALGGEYLGSCFIQNKPFYTSQNVNVLIPNWNMSENIKLFIATMIFKEGRTFYKAFIDELNRHIKTDFSILLPVDNKGIPDWLYMENFIETKKNILKKNLIKVII